jgi:hypothetical protein
MAAVIGMIGGGSMKTEQPLIEADDTWSDKLAAKEFVMGQMKDARVPQAGWFRLWMGGKPVTAKRPLRA